MLPGSLEFGSWKLDFRPLSHEFPHSLIFVGCAGSCRTDFVSSDPPGGERADAFQLVDVPESDAAASHAPPQTGTFMAAAAALPLSAAAGDRLCPSILFQRRHAAFGRD